MRRTGTREKRFAICVQNRGADDLEIRKVYRILPDKVSSSGGHLRVIDESGEDYLYPAKFFMRIELSQPMESAIRRAAG